MSQRQIIQLAEDVVGGNRLFGAFTQRPVDDDPDDDLEGVFRVGTAVAVHKTLRFPDGSMRILGRGVCRVEIGSFTAREPYLRARVRPHPDAGGSERRLRALVRGVRAAFVKIIDASENLPDELKEAVQQCEDGGRLADIVAANVDFRLQDKQLLLETFDPRARLAKLLKFLGDELQVVKLGEKLQGEIREEMDREQREYYLREQMKAIQKELGEGDEQQEIEELRKKIEAAGMPEEPRKEALRELGQSGKAAAVAIETSSLFTLTWQASLMFSAISCRVITSFCPAMSNTKVNNGSTIRIFMRCSFLGQQKAYTFCLWASIR